MPSKVGSHVGCHVADRSEGEGQRGRVSMMGFAHRKKTWNFVEVNTAGPVETIFKGYNLSMEDGIAVKTTGLHPTGFAKRLNHQIRPWPDVGDQRLLGLNTAQERGLHNVGEHRVGRSKYCSLHSHLH